MTTAIQWTMFFDDPTGRGWSEKLWYTGALTQLAINQTASQVVPARLNILGSDCKLLRVRCESGLPFGPFIIAVGGGSGQLGGYTTLSADSELRLLWRTDDGAGHYNKNYLSGVPRDQIAGATYTPTGSFPLLLTQYFNTLSAQLFVINSTLQQLEVFTHATQLTPTPPRGYLFQTKTPSNLVYGDMIHMKMAKGIGYNGRKSVTGVNVNQPVGFDTVFVGGASPIDPENVNTSSQWAIVEENSYPMVNQQTEGIVTRKTGRPFGLVRGRRSTVLSLRG